MNRHPLNRLGFIFFLSAFFVFSAAGASARRLDSKTKEDGGWTISDSSGEDGFAEEDEGGAVSRFKDDGDDTTGDDADSSRDQMNSKFKDDQDEDDRETDDADENQDEDS